MTDRVHLELWQVLHNRIQVKLEINPALGSIEFEVLLSAVHALYMIVQVVTKHLRPAIVNKLLLISTRLKLFFSDRQNCYVRRNKLLAVVHLKFVEFIINIILGIDRPEFRIGAKLTVVELSSTSLVLIHVTHRVVIIILRGLRLLLLTIRILLILFLAVQEFGDFVLLELLVIMLYTLDTLNLLVHVIIIINNSLVTLATTDIQR